MQMMAAAVVVAIGCTAEPPGAIPDVPPDEPVTPGPSTAQPGDDPATPQISMAPIAERTRHYNVPLSGTGPENGTLFFSVSGRGVDHVDLLGDGAFCLDIPIYKDQKLTVDIYAIDGKGRRTREVQVTVQQEGEPELVPVPTPPEARFENLALRQPASLHDLPLREGTVPELTDGDLTQPVKMGRGFWGDNQTGPQILVPLRRRTRVEAVEITPALGCRNQFYVYLSDKDTRPGLVGNAAWGGDNDALWTRFGGDAEPMYASWATVQVFGTFLNGNCDTFWNISGINEIKVFGRDPTVSEGPRLEPKTPQCGQASSR